MKYLPALLITILPAGTSVAQSFKADVTPLIEASCIGCHDAATETELNLETIGYDLADVETFRTWEKILDRVHDGEMPPESEDRPDPRHWMPPWLR